MASVLRREGSWLIETDRMTENPWHASIDRGMELCHLGMYPESLAAFRQILLLAPGEADAAREAYCHMAAVYGEMGWTGSDIEKWLDEEAQASPDPLVRGSICQALEWVRQSSA